MPYCNLPASLWDEVDFVRLPERAQILYIYLLTGPEAQAAAVPGLLVTGISAMAEARRKSSVEIHDTLSELIQNGFVEFDGPHRVIRVPRAPSTCPPGSPNVVIGWWRRWQSLPPSNLRMRHMDDLHQAVVGLRKWTDTWRDTFGSIVRLPTVATPSFGKIADKVATPVGKIDYSAVLDFGNGDNNGSESLSKAFSMNGVDVLCDSGKPLPKASDPDPDPDPYPISSSGSGSESGSGSGSRGPFELAEGTSPGLAANVFQQAKALWSLQEDLLAALPYETVPRDASADDLRRVVKALEDFTPEQLCHAQKFLAARAESEPDQARWFNRRSNWSPEVLRFAVDSPIAVAHAAGRKHFGGSALP